MTLIKSSKLLRFLIGSNPLTYILLYILVKRNNLRNYSYFTYTLTTPLYFGFMNVLSSIIFKYPLKNRLFLTFIISYNLVYLFSKYYNLYNYDNEQWNEYYYELILSHGIIWNITIYYIEKTIYNL